jgi:hypothetical protein
VTSAWPHLSDSGRLGARRVCRPRCCFDERVGVPSAARARVPVGGSSSAGPRPPTIAAMSRRGGRPLAQGATVRGLSMHLPHPGGRCCFASRSGTAADAASASRRIGLWTAGAMQHSAARGLTAGCRPEHKPTGGLSAPSLVDLLAEAPAPAPFGRVRLTPRHRDFVRAGLPGRPGLAPPRIGCARTCSPQAVPWRDA